MQERHSNASKSFASVPGTRHHLRFPARCLTVPVDSLATHPGATDGDATHHGTAQFVELRHLRSERRREGRRLLRLSPCKAPSARDQLIAIPDRVAPAVR